MYKIAILSTQNNLCNNVTRIEQHRVSINRIQNLFGFDLGFLLLSAIYSLFVKGSSELFGDNSAQKFCTATLLYS